ncbi:MAG: methyltransferase [Planctomycetes bacterium]|nr:methyltransferase [Planctomycetota bacterium]
MATAPAIVGTNSPFRLESSVDVGPLRRALKAAGYTQPALVATVDATSSGGRLDAELVLRRTQSPTPYHTLVRLFLLRREVPLESARVALAPASLEDLFEIGLLEPADGGVRSVATLVCLEDLVVAHDSEAAGQPLRSDHVLGVGAASMTLANLTVRRPIEAALDLGTGSGIQALLASPHARRVIATDTNPRALNFAAFNARLNEISNVELRQGSLYEPVEAERFDLIAANPPFVVSPAPRYAYRDSGMRGDAISEQVIRGAPGVLREGGFCTVLFNWHHSGDDDWGRRPLDWVRGSGCDAWILRYETTDPACYAATWLRQTEGRDPAAYSRALDEWLAYYEELGIEQLSYGAVILRRRSEGPNWIRAETFESPRRAGSCGGQIERIFAAQDLLQELGDDRKLLEQTLVLVPHHQMEMVLHAENGGWAVKSARITHTTGLEFAGNVDRMVSTLLAGCDGRRPLRELVVELGRQAGMDYERLAPVAAGIVRKMMQSGFLTPANGAAAAFLPQFGITWPFLPGGDGQAR